MAVPARRFACYGLVTMASVFGLSPSPAQSQETQKPAAAVAAPAESKPTWDDERAIKLQIERAARKRSKNVQETRRLVRQTLRQRSELGNELLTGGAWGHKTTEHIRIFFNASDEDRAGALEEKAEALWRQVSEMLGERDSEVFPPTEIFLVRNPAFWRQKASTDPFHTADFSDPARAEIYIDLDRQADLERAARHHLAHVLLQRRVDDKVWSGGAIPLWLDEGLAFMLSGDGQRPQRPPALRPLQELLGSNTPPADTARAQAYQEESASLIRFLIARCGAERLRDFIEHLLGSGVPYSYPRGQDVPGVRAREGFEFVMKNSAVGQTFKSFTDLESAWQNEAAVSRKVTVSAS